MNRAEAWELLNEYTTNPSLIKHALAVEAAMRYFARLHGEDEDTYGLTGLLHDFDYERWPSPEDHPLRGAEILCARGYPQEVIYAIKTHAEYLGLPRLGRLDKTLFAVDELCGFITAVALVRPGKNIHEVTPESVRKKMKDKRFAASVSRQDIVRGAEELGLALDVHINYVIDAMRNIAGELRLNGPEPG